MTWEELDWPALDRLRDGFLHGAAANGPYWQSASDLASYDLTYGERIGWKWDHVLRELRLRGWQPASRHVLDWGCGSGVAARRVISFFGAEHFDSLTVWDHSPAACDFAAEIAARAFPALNVAAATPGLLDSGEPIGLLLISHVLNELPPAALASLRSLVVRAAEVIWVEPGTRDVSRALGALREEFLPAFHVIAPCTHANTCPVLAPGRERDWCHHFAPPPGEIFADPRWVRFGQRAGIDLRSLPYGFFALDRARRHHPGGTFAHHRPPRALQALRAPPQLRRHRPRRAHAAQTHRPRALQAARPHQGPARLPLDARERRDRRRLGLRRARGRGLRTCFRPMNILNAGTETFAQPDCTPWWERACSRHAHPESRASSLPRNQPAAASCGVMNFPLNIPRTQSRLARNFPLNRLP
jgi:SAM-dependent methyltransferase